MTRVLKACLLALGIALMSGGVYAAKEDAKAAPAAAASKPASASDKSADKAKAGDMIDLNSASEKELMTLPQIGDARAKAIIKSRPYARKDELVSKKIVSQSVYDGIKDKVIAKQGSAKTADKASAKAADKPADKAGDTKK